MEKVVGYSVSKSVDLTLGAAEAVYTAGDVIKGSEGDLVFVSALRVTGAGGYITDAYLKIASSGAPANSYRLWLLNAKATIPADNVAFNMTFANFKSLVMGYIDFGAPVGAVATGTTDLYVSRATNLPMFVFPTGQDIYAVLTPLVGYTPSANTLIRIELGVDQN